MMTFIIRHAQGFGAELAFKDGYFSLFECRFKDVEFIGIHPPADNVLPQSPNRVDEDQIL